jgi:hypothetical protein
VQINLVVGWVAILAGLLLGAVIGTFFHRADWLGGYGSWPRRMLRLTHISLVGTGLLNLAFALSVNALSMGQPPRLASILFIAGAATMPTVCALSAWRPVFRHLFFIPVASLLIATAEVVYRGFWP